MQTNQLGTVAGRRRPAGLRRTLTIVIGLAALVSQLAPIPAAAAQSWTKNLYAWRAFLYQDPYPTACTAASTMIMLNVIAYRHSGGDAFGWTPYRVKNNTANRSDTRDMTSILYFARSHDTLSVFGSGSDGHGWRNALNAYGWGLSAMTNPTKRVYDDLEFTSYDAAVHAAVRAIARFDMPVGIITWAGGHAQVMTGYVVDGEDPAISDAFTVRYVFLSDPLYSDHYVNVMVSNASFRAGALHLRFQAYRETDSPYDDPYGAGWTRSAVSPTRGRSEWYHRWVIVAPIRGFVPQVSPPPDPGPSPSPTPTPDPSVDPSPSTSPDPLPSAAASSSPSPSPIPIPTPAASAAPSVAPSDPLPSAESSPAI